MNPSSIASIGGGAISGAGTAVATTSFAPALLLSPLLSKCATAAQRKQRKNTKHNPEGSEQRGGALDKLSEVFGTANNPDNELLLNDLPVLQARYHHPHRRGALFCRSGNWLEIVPYEHYTHRRGTEQLEYEDWHRRGRGYVLGTSKSNSPFSALEFIAVAFGLVSIRGVYSQNYLCMDRRGALYAAPPSKYTAECVLMEEMLENYYNLYSSCLFGTRKRAWYVALRRTGRPKVGRHTRRKQKSSHFLVVHFDNNDSNDGDGHDDHDGASANSQATVLQQHADSKVHPDELPTVVDRWKTYYSTGMANASVREDEGRRMTIEQWNPPAGNNHGGARQLASMPVVQSSTPVNYHRHGMRRHRWDERQPVTATTRAWSLPTTQAVRQFTPFDVGRSGIADGADTRLRRLERDERRRALRRLELENLRRSTLRTKYSHYGAG